jgi:Ca2+-transporting ATPase
MIQHETNLLTGLNTATVSERLQRDGYNQLIEKPPLPLWKLLLAQFKSVLILVLLIAAVVATVIGHSVDGAVIVVVVCINALLGFYQEFQAEKSLAALKKMLSLQTKVRRNGKTIELSATELVQGDIVLLEAGNKIPADGQIICAFSLQVDESALTGESVPVEKKVAQMLFMNNVVTRGRAEMIVTATGMRTEIGKLANLLNETEEEATPLQIQLDNLGKKLALIAILIVMILFASALWRGETLINTLFTAIALAVAAIPEGLPAVVTVTLALGMRRMAKHKAIVKRLAAVETLGCTTVICTDKTGTLTVNQMTVREFFYHDQIHHVSGQGYEIKGDITPPLFDCQNLLLPLVLCNDSQCHNQEIIGDPMEGALLVLAAKNDVFKETTVQKFPRLAEIPFDAEYKFMATFHQIGEDIKIFVKGAPEVLLSRCKANSLLEKNNYMANKGLRVLAIATKTIRASEFSKDSNLFHYLEELEFVALIGLQDPPRPEVRDAIKLCQHAGIAVKMITGDQKNTANAIAHELGLTGDILDGAQLAELNDQQLTAHVNQIGVFARIAPEQKLRIVNSLKRLGHVVAMTGDGVNDAPALKSADIGIAMGKSGTDVAKEAATMILTDDNFAAIVKAVHEGRGIYENMVKFIRFQLSTNIGAILCVAIAPLLGLPLPFTAIQLLWINIIMDGPPAMSLGVDSTRLNIMTDKPRQKNAQLLSWRRIGLLCSFGTTMTIGTLGILFLDLHFHQIEHATTLAFTTFVLFQIFNVFNARSEKDSAFNSHFFNNRWLWLSLVSVLILQITIVQWQPAQLIFKTVELSKWDWLIAMIVASSTLFFEETRKLLFRVFYR